MNDRISEHPGRVTLTPVAGQENTFDMVRADQPTQEGTPLNKATLLTDEVAEAIGLTSEDPTVNEALKKINSELTREINDGFKVGDIRISERNSLGGNYRLANGETFEPPDYPELEKMLPRVARLNLLASVTAESAVGTILDPSYTSGGGYYLISFGSTEGDSTSGYTTHHYVMYSKNVSGPYTVKKIGTTGNAWNASDGYRQTHHSVYANGKFYIHVPWQGIIYSASDPAGAWTETSIKNTSGSGLKTYSYSMFTYLDGMFVIAQGHHQYYTSDISQPWRVHDVASGSNNNVTLLVKADGWYYHFLQKSGYYSTEVYRSKDLLGNYGRVHSIGNELPIDVSTDGTTIYALTVYYNSDTNFLHVISPSSSSISDKTLSSTGNMTLTAELKNQASRNLIYARITSSTAYSASESNESSGVVAKNGRIRIAVEGDRAYIFLLTKESNTSPIALSVYSADTSGLPTVTIANAYAYIKVKEDVT